MNPYSNGTGNYMYLVEKNVEFYTDVQKNMNFEKEILPTCTTGYQQKRQLLSQLIDH